MVGRPLAVLALFVLVGATPVYAQGRKGPPGRNNGRQQFPTQAANNINDNSGVDATAIALQNMPNAETLAQMMMTNYDADASGELSQAELRAALEGLRQMIQQKTQAAQAAVATQQNRQALQNAMRNQMNVGLQRRAVPGMQGGRRAR